MKKPTPVSSRPLIRARRCTRRELLASGGAASLSTMALFMEAHGAVDAAAPRFRNDPEWSGVAPRRMHSGKGMIDVKIFFEPDRPSKPAAFLMYDIPPGGSEGEHTHRHTDPTGAWDEFYYIVSGYGQMAIDGRIVPVKAGDNVFTPYNVHHGIENTSSDANLKVYLVAISRRD